MKQKLWVLSVVLLAVMVTAIPALAAFPAMGTVVEGESVPGIALGDTRAQVEAANGSPGSCRSNNDPPTMESCSFDVERGGWVNVFYQGPDGGDATGSDGDVVSNIRWGGEEVYGWETTAGINTKLAKYDKQAAINAYPNADLYYDSVGRLYRLHDPELGIQVTWNHAYIFYTVSMSIFNPYTPPPPPVPIRVADIQMSYDRQSVTANVLILDEQDQPVEDAVVGVFWVYPLNRNNNTNMFVDGTTEGDGYATFKIGDKARHGDYRITITNVSKDGFKWDEDGSVLVGTITKPKK
jgi:hypothetical protein